jgi:hypothetical protein
VPALTQSDEGFATKFSYICSMKQQTSKNITTFSNEEMRENILRSLIASFRIEKINISESTAEEIYKKVKKKLKK